MERLASGLFLHWAKISVPISGKGYVDVILDYRLLAERNYLENRCWCWDSPSCPGVFSARQTGASFWGLISSSAPPLLVCKSTSSHCWPGSFNQHQLTLQDEVPFQFLSLGFVYPQCLSAGDEKYMSFAKRLLEYLSHQTSAFQMFTTAFLSTDHSCESFIPQSVKTFFGPHVCLTLNMS